jgi:hypothetical protein
LHTGDPRHGPRSDHTAPDHPSGDHGEPGHSEDE